MDKVVHKDTVYSPKEVQSISQLRQERWVLLAQMCKQTTRKDGPYFTVAEMQSMERRMQEIRRQLFKLTGNPIYNG